MTTDDRKDRGKERKINNNKNKTKNGSGGGGTKQKQTNKNPHDPVKTTMIQKAEIGNKGGNSFHCLGLPWCLQMLCFSLFNRYYS